MKETIRATTAQLLREAGMMRQAYVDRVDHALTMICERSLSVARNSPDFPPSLLESLKLARRELDALIRDMEFERHSSLKTDDAARSGYVLNAASLLAGALAVAIPSPKRRRKNHDSNHHAGPRHHTSPAA